MTSRTVTIEAEAAERPPPPKVWPCQLRKELRRELGCGPGERAVIPCLVPNWVRDMVALIVVDRVDRRGERADLELILCPAANCHLSRTCQNISQSICRVGRCRPCIVGERRRSTRNCSHGRPIMRYLGERPCCHDLGLPDEELALGLDMKVARVETGHERDQDSDLCRVERRCVMPPAFVSCSQLSELLGLLRPLDPSPLITAPRDGLDQGRPTDVRDRQSGGRHRRARALQIDSVGGIAIAELHPVGIILHRVVRGPIGHAQLKARASAVAYDHRPVGSDRVGTAPALE